MLLEIAVADSYGIAFEFVKDPASHNLKNDLTFQQNPRYHDLLPSQYTDDTLRSIATWRVISLGGKLTSAPFNPTLYAHAIKTEFLRDKRAGWSKKFQAYLQQSEDIGETALDFMRGISTRAESNGSIMGSLPCGFLQHPVDVRLAAAAQAVSTHSAATIPYAQAMALAAHFHIYDLGKRDELSDFLWDEVEGYDQAFDLSASPQPVDMTAKQTATAVLHLLEGGKSLTGIMTEAVNVGGDTDSVAALAVGIASCCDEYDQDIPQHLIEQLDQGGEWGAGYLRALDEQMLAYKLSG